MDAMHGHLSDAYSRKQHPQFWSIEPSPGIVNLTIWFAMANLVFVVAEYNKVHLITSADLYLGIFPEYAHSLIRFVLDPFARYLSIIAALLVLKSRKLAFWLYLVSSLLIINRMLLTTYFYLTGRLTNISDSLLLSDVIVNSVSIVLMSGFAIHLYRIWFRKN